MNVAHETPISEFESWCSNYVLKLWSRCGQTQALRRLPLLPQHPRHAEQIARADAERFAEKNPGSRILRGWIYLPFHEPQRKGADFLAHTALQLDSGELISASDSMGDRFLPADLAEGDYLALVDTLIRRHQSAVLRIALSTSDRDATHSVG